MRNYDKYELFGSNPNLYNKSDIMRIDSSGPIFIHLFPLWVIGTSKIQILDRAINSMLVTFSRDKSITLSLPE